MRNDLALFRALIADWPLEGYEPHGIYISNDGTFYISIKDTIHILEISSERIRGLVHEKRLKSVKPGGRDLFISLSSIGTYLKERKSSGRPHSHIP